MNVCFSRVVKSFCMRALFLIVILAGLSGCDDWFAPSRQPGEIPFVLTGLTNDACPLEVTVEGQPWTVDHFAFYLSNPEIRIDGRWHAIAFHPSEWQTKNIALLSFHNACGETPSGNQSIVLNASEKLMKLATNLRFTLAVPFENNHALDTPPTAPLGAPNMFLNAQNGHYYLRLDMHKTISPTETFAYHLGSAECESVSPKHAPNRACGFTNRIEFILPMLQFDTELTLELSVSNIVSQVNFSQYETGCVFTSPEQAPCDQLLRNLLQRPWIQWDDNVYKI